MARRRSRRRSGKKQSKFLLILICLAAVLVVLYYHRYYGAASVPAVSPAAENAAPQPAVRTPPAEEQQQASHPDAAAAPGALADATPVPAEPASAAVVLPAGLEVPVCGLKNHAPDHELRNFTHYALCYREAYEQAEWSAYELTADELVKNASRSNDFRQDDMISTQSATPADYKGSGYDRGHLTPAADMAFDELAMSETFYMSNMSPQAPQLNRGVWKHLEAQIRTWASRFGKVYVVSGPVLDKPASDYAAIGTNKVSVPEYYYKTVLAPSEDGMTVLAIGFIIPNQKCEDSFWSYAVPVDKVEQATGLDFYALLDDRIEDAAEASADTAPWK